MCVLFYFPQDKLYVRSFSYRFNFIFAWSWTNFVSTVINCMILFLISMNVEFPFLVLSSTQLYNYFEDSNYVYLVLEIAHNGEFQRYLRTQNRVLTELEARKVMKQIVEGMLYLHTHGILHRDLTLSNLLLTRDMNTVS